MNTSFKPLKLIGVCAATLMINAGRAGENGSEVGVEVQPIRVEKLLNAPGQSLTAVSVTYAPGGRSSAHRHAGSVFAYVVSGSIKSENSATGPAKIYHAGESFFEPQGSRHLVSENASATEPARMLVVFVAEEGANLTSFSHSDMSHTENGDLARRIFETMAQVHGVASGRRPVHAKGLVCEGTFTPTKAAGDLSKAAHFNRHSTPVVVRFSDGAPDPYIPDGAPNAGPRGLAVRFKLPDGAQADIVAMSHNGFVVGSGLEFLELQKALVATDPSKEHPWAVEAFLAAHPLALRFVQENAIVPASLANESFFSNNAFILLNRRGERQTVRFQILPVAGSVHLADTDAKGKPVNYLFDDLRTRLASAAVEFRLVVQMPRPGDPTNDPSLVWPDDRKKVEIGTVTITSVASDNDTAEGKLAFDPTNLTEGIELSDDPMPALRSEVYSLSVKHRRHTELSK